MRTILRSIAIVALSLLAFQSANANNVAVSNVTLVGQNVASDFTFVQFDITWENSWRDTGNWDASWVFLKFSLNNGNTWNHATLYTTGHTAPTGATIDTPAENNGVFIYRDAVGSGTNTWNGVQLKWDYGTNGVSDNDTVQVKVFAIETIYIPQAAFYVGGGNTTNRAQFVEGGGENPFQISSELAIPVGNTAGQLFYLILPALSGDGVGPIPAPFPKGFNAFYMMKYEITQEQYKDFLNCLTYNQQNTRTATSPNSVAGTGALTSSTNTWRNGIDIQTPGTTSTIAAVYANNLDGDTNFNEDNDGQNIACNWLSWMDGAAYADWAGLRPMTELEYEKACRGDQPPVANEFAWGTANIASSYYTLANRGSANEKINSNYATAFGIGNALTSSNNFQISDGPVRAGIFADNALNTIEKRIHSGAGFYGNMELSGNLVERAVTLGNPMGRGFIGTVGDGSLSAAGNATNSDWPGFSAGEVTGAIGSGFKGGSFSNPLQYLLVLGRDHAALVRDGRSLSYGFRCVRQAN